MSLLKQYRAVALEIANTQEVATKQCGGSSCYIKLPAALLILIKVQLHQYQIERVCNHCKIVFILS